MTYFSKSWVWNQFKLSKSNLSKNFELQLLHLKNLFIGFISITFQSERIICFRFFFCLYSLNLVFYLFLINIVSNYNTYLFTLYEILKYYLFQYHKLLFYTFLNLNLIYFKLCLYYSWEDNYYVLSNIILPSSHFLCTKKANYFKNN
jgi:hypothetical protein